MINKLKNTIAIKIDSLSKPAIIAVSGFGGSGKSTMAKKISSIITAPVVEVDSFCRGDLDTYDFWSVFDYDRLLQEVIIPFTFKVSKITYREYDWENSRPGNMVPVEKSEILIIEGVGLFRPQLMKYFSLKIWVDCSLEEAIRRGKKRDRDEYNNPQDELWDGIWRENDMQCYEVYKPKENADVIINHKVCGEYVIVEK